MADLFHNKLLHSLSSNSSRFPLFSLSRPSILFPVRLISTRRTRLFPSPSLARLSHDSSQLHIISTSEHSDGSIVFRFGDAREVRENVENAESAKDDEVDDKESLIGAVGRSNCELDTLRTSESKVDDSDEKSEVEGASGGEVIASDGKFEAGAASGGEQDGVDEKLKVSGASDGELDELEVVVNSGDEVDASDVKLEVVETSNGEPDANLCEKKLEVGGTSGSELDANCEKFEAGANLVGEQDASDENLKMSGVSDGEVDASGEKVEAFDGEHDISDAKMEMLETLDGALEVKFEAEIVNDAELPKVEGNDSIAVEHSENGKWEYVETPVEYIERPTEIAGSRDVADESSPNVLAEEIDNGDLVKLTQQAVHLETEPIIVQEESSDSVEDSVAMESVLGDDMQVNAATLSTLAQPEDDPVSGDILEAATLEASGITSAETNINCENSMEISATALSISSDAVALPHPSEALTGGEDAYFVNQNWFGIADGIGQWSLGGTNKGLYAQELMQNCEKLTSKGQIAGLTNTKEVLHESAAMTHSSGSARVLIAHFDNQALHVANIGDSGFIIIRNGAVFQKSSPMVHEFNFPYAISSGDDVLEVAEDYHIELEGGDVIITATDGLFDNLYEQEIASIVSMSLGTGMEPKELAEFLAVKAQEVGKTVSARCPFADTAQAAGHAGYTGGKLDHVTVIVSVVQNR